MRSAKHRLQNKLLSKVGTVKQDPKMGSNTQIRWGKLPRIDKRPQYLVM